MGRERLPFLYALFCVVAHQRSLAIISGPPFTLSLCAQIEREEDRESTRVRVNGDHRRPMAVCGYVMVFPEVAECSLGRLESLPHDTSA